MHFVSLPRSSQTACPVLTQHGQTLQSMGCFCSLLTMMSDAPPPPITTYWTTADRACFVDYVKAGHININDTTPSEIDAFRNKYWAHKSIRSFRINYRKVASDLLVERSAHGGRGTCMPSPQCWPQTA